jgi:threonine aldolase
VIDLTSDNASQPSVEMRRAMSRAEVGDEGLLRDPTVRILEGEVADLCGKQAALFMPSGTMCNIVAFFVQCAPDDVVVMHESSHPVYSGYMGGADLPGRPRAHVVAGDRGVITPCALDGAVEVLKNESSRAALLSIENTHNRSGGSA